jgi:hypothetical protein
VLLIVDQLGVTALFYQEQLKEIEELSILAPALCLRELGGWKATSYGELPRILRSLLLIHLGESTRGRRIAHPPE